MKRKKWASHVILPPAYNADASRRFGLRYTDFDGFLKWIKASFHPIYKRIPKIKASARRLENVLPVLLEELQLGESARRQIALQIIIESATAIHRDPFFNEVPSNLQTQVVDAVSVCLTDRDAIVKRLAVKALAPFLKRWERQLAQTLADHGVNNTDAETALFAIEQLGRVEINLRSLAVPSLIHSLGHEDESVRQAACDALRNGP